MAAFHRAQRNLEMGGESGDYVLSNAIPSQLANKYSSRR